jgi:hypothetical protein
MVFAPFSALRLSAVFASLTPPPGKRRLEPPGARPLARVAQKGRAGCGVAGVFLEVAALFENRFTDL